MTLTTEIFWTIAGRFATLTAYRTRERTAMAANLEGEALVRSLDTHEQRIEAARLLREYHEETQKIIRLKGELNQQGKQLTEPEIREIKKGIADCEERRVMLMDRMEQEYHAQAPRQLDIVLKQRGIDSIASQYGYLAGQPQQKQSQSEGVNQQGAQSEVRTTSLEKDAVALERVQESIEHLKKAVDEAEKAKKNYQLMEEECAKAFEIMQQVNFELAKGNKSVMEIKEGQLPEQQHDGILDPRLREAFGTGSVNEVRMSIRESLRNRQEAGRQEPVQESQKQSEKSRDFSNPQSEQSQPRQPEEGKKRNTISGEELRGKYNVENDEHYVAEQHHVEEQHNVAKRGRQAEAEKEVKKGRTMG